jgi:transposase-like protein
MDEAFLTINGARSDLWRAVDQDDNVLDVLMQSRRNKKATKKFFKNKYNCSIRSWGSMRPGRCCLPTLPSG